MRVLVGTPCGGGQVTTNYLLSYSDMVLKSLQVKQQMYVNGKNHAKSVNPSLSEADLEQIGQQNAAQGPDIGIYTLSNESLLPRGRNHLAQVALMNKWDKLFFIDADAGWSWENFAKIVQSNSPLVAGVCPLKTYPISLNYLPFAKDEKYYVNAQRSVQGMRDHANGTGDVELSVPFVGTAFMCIDVSLLRLLSKTTLSYKYPNPYTGKQETHWDFFNSAPVNGTYMSEDWGFCHIARKAGVEVKIHTEVIITHMGSHTFRAV